MSVGLRRTGISNRSLVAASAQKRQPILVPMIGESQSGFFDRAMRALRRSIPSINRRTLEVLRLWRMSDNDRDLRDQTLAQFPADRFQHFDPRCVFLEHTIPASSDGQLPELHYDREALQHMVDWGNYRIRNSNTYSVIADGHTPNQSELSAGRPMPDVLGYAGPFYLGQLGDVNPRWAIYADEWVHVDDVPQYTKRQRRSPEVWVSEPIERRTMDPIAALGAETPRLDCGMNSYSRAGDGQTVMSYSAMTFASPSFVPVPGSDLGTQLSSGDLTMPLTISDSNQVQDAAGQLDSRILEQTVLKTVTALLPSIVRAVQQELANQVDADSTSDSDDDDSNSGYGDAPRGLDSTDDIDALLEDSPEAAMQYSALSGESQRAYRAGWQRAASVTHRYSRNSDLHKVVARQQVRLQELSDQISRERRDAARYSKLSELARDFAFDPRDEAETCQDMSDKQFERHCTSTIVKYARRDDVTNVQLFTDPTVPVDRFGAGSASRISVEQVERYSREAAAVAARKNAAKRGSTTFEAEFDAICKQHGLSI